MNQLQEVAWAIFYSCLLGVPLGIVVAGAYFGLDAADVVAACVILTVGAVLTLTFPYEGEE